MTLSRPAQALWTAVRPLVATILSSALLAALVAITLLPSPLAAASDVRPTPAASTAPGEPQRIEVADAGISVSFPAGWRVSTTLVRRASWFEQGDGVTPVYAWSVVFATAGDGRWCDIDRYEDFPWPFDEHAAFLERWHVSGNLYGRDGGSARVVLPAGVAYRIELDDELKGRSSVRYLFEYGADRILLTCTDALGSDEDWREIAASMELGPRSLVVPPEVGSE